MADKLGFNIIIEREHHNKIVAFVASSPDINVLAEGKTIEEAQEKFVSGVKHHLKTFPEERANLQIKENGHKIEMPLLTRIFL